MSHNVQNDPHSVQDKIKLPRNYTTQVKTEFEEHTAHANHPKKFEPSLAGSQDEESSDDKR